MFVGLFPVRRQLQWKRPFPETEKEPSSLSLSEDLSKPPLTLTNTERAHNHGETLTAEAAAADALEKFKLT